MTSLTDEIKRLAGSESDLKSRNAEDVVENGGINTGEVKSQHKIKLLKQWFKVPRRSTASLVTERDSYRCYVGSFDTVPRMKVIRRNRGRLIASNVSKLKESVLEMTQEEAKKLKELEETNARITRSRSSVSPQKSIKKVVDVSSDEYEDQYDAQESSDESLSSDEEIGYKSTKASPKRKYTKRKAEVKVKDEEFKLAQPAKRERQGQGQESKTNFVFINGSTTSPVKRTNKTKATVAKSNFVLRSDAFQSPKKQREGVLLLSKTPSPNKKGFMLSPLKLTPSSSGRSGSPRKIRKFELQDQSARKRANRTLYSKLLNDGIDEDESDEDYNENIEIAERIILESKKSTQDLTAVEKPSPFATPKKQLKPFDLPIYNPDFVPSPLPTKQSTEDFFEGKYNATALFLDGSDGYFEQNSALLKPSHNSMTQAPHLDYDEFNSFVLFSEFLHNDQKQKLNKKYKEMYHQYLFEIKEDFNLLFYGVGSKRLLLLNFVQDYLLDYIDVPVLVVNGYNPAVKFNEVIMEIFNVLDLNKKLPRRTNECIDYLVDYFKNKPNTSKMIILFHNIDGESFRDEKIQNYISKIASVKQIHLIASMDHISAPLLWDSLRLSNFNFVWHNVPTYKDYITEISFKDPLMLGQSQKTSGSNGAKYVLSSLTSSSKGLYKILAQTQLKNMKEHLVSKQMTSSSNGLRGQVKFGVEFTIFFRLCVEEFITSNEVNFRTMLMEFVEHKMAVLTRDRAGTEMVYVPYSYDELHQLLESEFEA